MLRCPRRTPQVVCGGPARHRARMLEPTRVVADPPRVLLDEPASGMTADERRALSCVVRRPAAQTSW